MSATKRIFAALIALALAAPLAARAQGVESPLLALTRPQEGAHSKRISSYDRTGGNNDRFEAIPTGERRTLAEIEGAGMINHIWITIAPPPPDLSRHDIILRMYWDGEKEPSVEAPIGDFFGQGWNENYPFVTMPLAAGPRKGQAMVSYWNMPFSKGARIEVENDTGRKIDAFYYYVDYVALDKAPDSALRFHAWYNHEAVGAAPEGENEWSLLGEQTKNKDGARNYLMADIVGKGHYVGVNYYVHSPSPMWYGEGDDMFFIDGENFPPSLHGTGTEDYFNTSWSPKELYTHPFYGYARVNEDVGWLGRTHVYRFHITDPIYFDKSLRFSIEHGHNNNLAQDISSVAYWYQTEPHKTFPPFPSREARKPRDFVDMSDMHLWRNEWRKNMGGDPKLWGDERKPKEIKMAETDKEGWKQLFNGKDKNGWKMVGPGDFTVKDGKLVAEGGMGLLWYEKEKFGDCELKAVFRMTKETDNSGIFIRIDGKPADPWYAVHRGYEVQIAMEGDKLHRTGCLYSLTELKADVPTPVGEWTTLLIRMEGKKTTVTLNGTLVTEYVEGQPVPEKTKWYEPDRGPRPDSGFIGIQNHHDGSAVEFKEIAVKALAAK